MEINLLSNYSEKKKPMKARMKANQTDRILTWKIDKEFWDGTRQQGYGGYKYDGRWVPVAKDIIKHYELKKNDKILDIGCAKGFLVKDLLNQGIDAYGIDISEYAISKSEKETIGRLHLGKADKLPFPDNSFDFVISINTIHNYDENGVITVSYTHLRAHET